MALLTANAWTLGTSRVVYSSAREGLLPRRLATIDRAGTPYAAVLGLTFAYGASVAVLVIVDTDESKLITATSAAFLVVFLIAVAAGSRILEGRLRILSYFVATVTLVLLPFFSSSIPWAAGIGAVALATEWISTRYARGRLTSALLDP